MEKTRIILADLDVDYILPLQYKFIEVFFDKIELEIITDYRYFEYLFETPQQAQILIVSEQLYRDSLLRHNINHIFLMKENQYSSIETENDARIVPIYKYSSVKEIFEAIIGRSNDEFKKEQELDKETSIIVVTSANGGAGKTTVAMGISINLAKNYKKVLFLDANWLQNFQIYLTNQASINDQDVYMQMAGNRDGIYEKIKHLIRNEMFDYLPPFKAPLISLGISRDIVKKIALEAKREKEYDYIIIDTDSSFDEEKMELANIANKVIVVMNQDEASVMNTNLWVKNIDGANTSKFIYICNKYDLREKNAIVSSEKEIGFTINDYVEKTNVCWEMIKEKNMALSGIQRVAVLIM